VGLANAGYPQSHKKNGAAEATLALSRLKGRGKGRFAVDASGHWRITFAWDGEDAIDVDLEDYH
jgi:proteic killer suppression protein